MDEQTLRELIKHVKTGRLSRRLFVQTLMGFGSPGHWHATADARATRAQPKT